MCKSFVYFCAFGFIQGLQGTEKPDGDPERSGLAIWALVSSLYCIANMKLKLFSLGISVANPGYLSRIRVFFSSRIQGQKDSGSASKNFSDFNPINYFFLCSRKNDLGCSSWIRIRIVFPSRIQG
jgi:hypothetical protein